MYMRMVVRGCAYGCGCDGWFVDADVNVKVGVSVYVDMYVDVDVHMDGKGGSWL